MGSRAVSALSKHRGHQGREEQSVRQRQQTARARLARGVPNSFQDSHKSDGEQKPRQQPIRLRTYSLAPDEEAMPTPLAHDLGVIMRDRRCEASPQRQRIRERGVEERTTKSDRKRKKKRREDRFPCPFIQQNGNEGHNFRGEGESRQKSAARIACDRVCQQVGELGRFLQLFPVVLHSAVSS
jgi:hypothetical protein